MAKVQKIEAKEILDSRGNPTIETIITLDDGAVGRASVPSGASIGKYEAIELRDDDPNRFGGMGVLKAVQNVSQVIAPKIIGLDSESQLEIDQLLITLDGTPNKSRLGANTLLSVSQAVCEAQAISEKVPLWQHIGHLTGLNKENLKIPTPIFNLINGGKHGAGNLDFQEFQIIPATAKTYSLGLQMGEEIYQATKKVLTTHGAIHSVGDEGGFAPNLLTNLDALEILIKAFNETKYGFGKDVFLGLDIAAASFFKQGRYFIKDKSGPLSEKELLEFYRELTFEYPLALLEDPFVEDDWDSWIKLHSELAHTFIVGDDLLATNQKRLEEAITKNACNAILVKPNQVGTIAETIMVIKTAQEAGFKVIVSHRSGETIDDFIADFSVGTGADYVKFGAPARGERVAKYNRLLEIEKEIGL